MSMVHLVAIEPCNQHGPGDSFHCGPAEAEQLIARRLAKMATPPQNKMLPDPANKANPSRAVGEAPMSSASPAAPASVQTTARPSVRGARAVKMTATTLPTPGESSS